MSCVICGKPATQTRLLQSVLSARAQDPLCHNNACAKAYMHRERSISLARESDIGLRAIRVSRHVQLILQPGGASGRTVLPKHDISG